MQLSHYSGDLSTIDYLSLLVVDVAR